MPNAALAQGDIDVNNYQHLPYLENQITQRGYDIVALEKSIIVPLGLYSKKLTGLSEIPFGAPVAIPNDPSNEARSLILLEKAGLVKLKECVGTSASLADIVGNTRGLKVTQLDAAQLPRSLEDVDFAAVTLNYALGAGLDPKKALFLEGADSESSLWFAALRDRKDDPRIRRYIEIYRSQAVKDFLRPLRRNDHSDLVSRLPLTNPSLRYREWRCRSRPSPRRGPTTHRQVSWS